MSTPIEAAETWIAARLNDVTLAGLASGGVWADRAPASAVGTIVRWHVVDASDTVAVATEIASTFVDVQVLVIAEGRSRPSAAADRVQTLLHGQQGVAAARRVISHRLAPLAPPIPPEGGTEYRCEGAIYRVTVNPTT